MFIAIDLIIHLLSVKIRQRYTVDKALLHVWLQDYCLWSDLRSMEQQLATQPGAQTGPGSLPKRWLTCEVDDDRWEAFRVERRLPHWHEIGRRIEFSRTGVLVASLADAEH